VEQRPLRRHLNADVVSRTRLTFKEHQSQSGLCSICVMDGVCEVGLKAKTGRPVFPQPFGTAQFGAEKRLPNLEDIQILPELFGEGVEFTEVETEVEIGGFKCRAPVTVAAMGSTRVAANLAEELSIGAARAGIPIVVGENVFSTYGKEGLEKRIRAFLDHYDGYGGILVQGNANEMRAGILEIAESLGAMGIEIKLGQGAKQGLGGEIKFSDPKEAEKYRKMGYTVRETGDGNFERHSDPGTLTPESLEKVLLSAGETGLPIWVKTGMGTGIRKLIDLLEEAKRNYGLKISCLTVDGFGGGTGMSPWVVMNETSVPSAALFSSELKPGFDVLLAGGYADGADVAKALMLGASGVALGRPMLIAANAKNYPDGKELGPGEGIANFVSAVSEELKMICASQRVRKVSDLKSRRENLYPLTEEAARLFGLRPEIR